MGHNDMGDFYYGRGDLQVCVSQHPQSILSALAKITLSHMSAVAEDYLFRTPEALPCLKS